MGITYTCFTLVITWIAAVLGWVICVMAIDTCSTLSNVSSIAEGTGFVAFRTSTRLSVSIVSSSTVLCAGTIKVDEPLVITFSTGVTVTVDTVSRAFGALSIIS